MKNKLFTYNLSLITSCLLILGAHNAYASCDNQYEACLKYHGGRCEDKLKSCNMSACGEEECAPHTPAGIAGPAPAPAQPAPATMGNSYWNWPPENMTTTGSTGTTSTGVGATAPTGTRRGTGTGTTTITTIRTITHK